jgi:hypothetical protein
LVQVRLHFTPIGLDLAKVSYDLDQNSLDLDQVRVDFEPISFDLDRITLHFDPIRLDFDRISLDVGPISVDLHSVSACIDRSHGLDRGAIAPILPALAAGQAATSSADLRIRPVHLK